MRKILCSIIVMVFAFPAVYAQETTKAYYTNVKPLLKLASTENVKYTYSIYQLSNLTYAYVIFVDGKRYLHQQNMPGKPLLQGFNSKEDAQKVAELVIKKLEFPIEPPRVSIREMQYMGIQQP